MSRVDDESNDGFVVHKQSGDRTDLHVEQLLNILWGAEGHIRSRYGVDCLQCEPKLIYTYLQLHHGTAMLCICCHTERQWTGCHWLLPLQRQSQAVE